MIVLALALAMQQPAEPPAQITDQQRAVLTTLAELAMVDGHCSLWIPSDLKDRNRAGWAKTHPRLLKLYDDAADEVKVKNLAVSGQDCRRDIATLERRLLDLDAPR